MFCLNREQRSRQRSADFDVSFLSNFVRILPSVSSVENDRSARSRQSVYVVSAISKCETLRVTPINRFCRWQSSFEGWNFVASSRTEVEKIRGSLMRDLSSVSRETAQRFRGFEAPTAWNCPSTSMVENFGPDRESSARNPPCHYAFSSPRRSTGTSSNDTRWHDGPSTVQIGIVRMFGVHGAVLS